MWFCFLIPVLMVSAYETVFIYKCIACVFKYLGSIISVSSKGLPLHRLIQIVKYNSLEILILIQA